MATLKYLSFWSVMGVVLISPTVVGVFPILPAIIIQGVVFVFCCYALGSANSNSRSKQTALVLLAVSFAITLADSVSRPLLSAVAKQRPQEIAAHALPKLPLVYRFRSNVDFRGATFGDLADLSTRKDWREEREMTFRTDGYGLRNNPSQNDQSLDLIVLG